MSLFSSSLQYVGPVYNGAVRLYAPALERWAETTTTNALKYVPERGRGGGRPPSSPAPPGGKGWVTTFTDPVLDPVGVGVEKGVEKWIRSQVEPEVTEMVIKAALAGLVGGFVLARLLK